MYYLVVGLVDHLKHIGIKHTFSSTSNKIRGLLPHPRKEVEKANKQFIKEMNTKGETMILITK